MLGRQVRGQGLNMCFPQLLLELQRDLMRANKISECSLATRPESWVDILSQQHHLMSQVETVYFFPPLK